MENNNPQIGPGPQRNVMATPELELMDLDPRTMTVRDQRLCIEAAQRWLSLFGMARIARREKVPDYYHEAKDSLRSLVSLIERGEQR